MSSTASACGWRSAAQCRHGARPRRARAGETPQGLFYSAASRSIDGAPAVDRDKDEGLFELGDIEPGRSVDVALAGVVGAPIAHGQELPIGARVEWSTGSRQFARTVTVKSAEAFTAAFDRIERETPRRLSPGARASYTIHLENMGADIATDARLHLEADKALEKLKVTENDAELTLGDDGAIHLDKLEPNAPRTLQVEGRITGTIEDESQVRLRATLRAAQLGEIEIGSAQHAIASRPRFSAKKSTIVPENGEVLRPRTLACRMAVHNEGTDCGRDVRVRLQLPDELRLESVENAQRDAETVVFGKVPAQETREATIHLRLLGAAASKRRPRSRRAPERRQRRAAVADPHPADDARRAPVRRRRDAHVGAERDDRRRRGSRLHAGAAELR
jgi:hypothetical protein